MRLPIGSVLRCQIRAPAVPRARLLLPYLGPCVSSVLRQARVWRTRPARCVGARRALAAFAAMLHVLLHAGLRRPQSVQPSAVAVRAVRGRRGSGRLAGRRFTSVRRDPEL